MPLLIFGVLVLFGSGLVILRHYINNCKDVRQNHHNPYIIRRHSTLAHIPQSLPNQNSVIHQPVPPKYEDVVVNPPEQPPSYETQH